jgi:hypothetical protein
MKCNRTACDRKAHPDCTHTDAREGAYCLLCAVKINRVCGQDVIRMPDDYRLARGGDVEARERIREAMFG